MSEVLGRFALKHHEIVARRMHNIEKKQTTTEAAPSVPEKKPSTAAAPNGSPEKKGLKSYVSGSQISGKDRGKEKSTPPTKKRDVAPKKEDKGKKDEKDTRAKKISSADQKKGRGKAKKASESLEDGAKPLLLEHCNPLDEPVEEIGGDKYILGNRALTNLNLSYNFIDEAGLAELWSLVQFQSSLQLPLGSGLMRLSVDVRFFDFLALDMRNVDDLAELLSSRCSRLFGSC
eukprot:m.95408 g.95408  ORF g.95408 m.95408 type:complete len:232 (+) comp36850_c0_seq11:802-1497(+)